jgi:predicted TIM-barrel fold metal-dependent hydrolase
MNRRQFVQTAAAAACTLGAQDTPNWGGPVLDIHLHMRRNVDDEMIHMQGSGVTHAVLLTRAASDEQIKARKEKYPGKYVHFASTDTAKPEAVDLLRTAIKNGAIGMGELKSHVACDGPEMRRIYDLAAETGVPVLMHFADVEQYPGEGTWNSGIARMPAILKAYPRTTFIGHADGFWANISADPGTTSYPTDRVKPGGLTDKMLADYPNLYADLSANSGRNSLARDPEFSKGFLVRHQNKLMFGCDCSCRDGRGTGQGSQAPLIKGKCVARETLTALKELASAEVFRKIAFGNGVKLLKIKV